MNIEEIKEILIKIFKENCPFLEDGFSEHKLTEIGVNSIKFIKIVTDIEDYFDIEFEDEDLNNKNFPYLLDVCKYIENIKKSE